MKLNIIKNKKIIEKIINLLLNFFIAILSIILLVITYTGVQVKLLGQDYSNFFGYTMFEVQTNSMKDAISAGDWIVVKLNSKIALKDIITYKLGNEYITHRVVEIHDKTYVTRGDANNDKDKPIDKKQVVGKVEKIFSGFGIFRKTILNPAVLIIMIISLFLIESIVKDKKEIENTNKFNKILYKILDLLKDKMKKGYIFIKKNIDSKIKKKSISENMTENKLPNNEELIITNELSDSDIIEVNFENENIDQEKNNDVNNNESAITEVKVDYNQEDSETLDDSILKIELFDDKEEDNDEYIDDLEKTQFFRIIPVDTNELDETKLEIAKYEIANQGKELNETKKIEVKVEPKDEAEETLTNINLDLLKSNNRKNKNTIDALMNIKVDELNELVQLIIDDDKLQTNEPTIRNAYIMTYIHARYYNYFAGNDLNYKGKNFLVKVDKLFKAVGKELVESYNGSDNKYSEKVDKFINIFNIIASLDQAKDSISEVKTKREYYKNEISKLQNELEPENVLIIVSDIIKLQKTYDEITKYFLKKLESNIFYLDFETIKKDFYAVKLNHNIAFNKVYSDYIIDKTYEEGIIAEDKMPVKITLLIAELLNNMTNCDFNKKYFLMLPETLYGKEKKIRRVLKMLDDEYAKSHVTIMIDFETLITHKKIIKKIRKSGFKFAIGFKNSINIPAKEKSCLYMASVIFINDKDKNYENIEKYIPSDLNNFIIYDDVYSKFDNLEGD